MQNGPRLRLTCGRCGEPREGIRHDCVVSSGRAARRKATPKLKLDFGKCMDCKKVIGNPLTHVCAPRSDFKKRKRKAEREAKAKARKPPKTKPGTHDYLACKDDGCPRPLCVAYKTGWKEGLVTGFAEGFEAGIAACPRPHSGG